jgi:hypothetical protein
MGNIKKRATSPKSDGPTEAFTNSSDSTSKWRQQYRVHPAADVFPMMSDAELATLGADIKAHGLKHAILFYSEEPIDDRHACTSFLIDGRNRLEAMERVGLELDPHHDTQFLPRGGDPVALVISLNIHRRQLTKQQQADLIVAAIKAGEKLPQVEHVSKGGRGKKNPVKTKAIAAAKANGISESTIERALAKAEWTPEEIEARRQKFAEQAARRDERTREQREYKEEQKRERESNVAEALTILEALDLDTAVRLVDLLLRESVCASVSMALYDKQTERDDARSEVDDLLRDEAEQAVVGGYRAFFRDNFKMRLWELRPTKAAAVKDLEDFFADEWIEYTDGTRRRRPTDHGLYCVATEERFQAIANVQENGGSWCSVGPTEDEIFRAYDGPSTLPQDSRSEVPVDDLTPGEESP